MFQLLPLNPAGGGGGRQSDEPPEVGSCHRGEVKRIEAYGVFVALQGYRKYGLVHASQVRAAGTLATRLV
jgi:polyribonucleotide nucleotidyltransferase